MIFEKFISNFMTYCTTGFYIKINEDKSNKHQYSYCESDHYKANHYANICLYIYQYICIFNCVFYSYRLCFLN